MKKKLALFLSIILLFISVWGYYSQPVQASAPNTIMNFLKAALIEKGKEVSGDYIFDFFNWMYNLYEDSNQELCDFMSKDSLNQFLTLLPDALGLQGEVITQADINSYIVKKEFLDAIDSLFEQYLQETPEAVEVVWIPTISSDAVSANFFSTVTGYYKFRSWTDNVPISAVSGRQYRETSQDYSYKNAITFQPIDNFVFIQNTPGTFPWSSFVPAVSYWTSIWGSNSSTAGNLSRLITYTQDGTQTDYPTITHAMALNDGATIEDASSKIWKYPAEYQLIYPFNRERALFTTSAPPDTLLVRGCNTDAPAYVPVFKNVNAYKSWITGQAGYYQFDSGYKGGNVTINPNADYSQITDAIQDVMMQASANGDNIEAMLSQMQAAFSKALAEISGTLGDIDDNTAASNYWLEQIYNKLRDLYDMIDFYHHGESDLENNN